MVINEDLHRATHPAIHPKDIRAMEDADVRTLNNNHVPWVPTPCCTEKERLVAMYHFTTCVT